MLALYLTACLHLAPAARRATTVLRRRLGAEQGQTTAEYALVLLGVAAVALLVTAWAGGTDKIGKLLDAVFNGLLQRVKDQ